MDIKTSWRVTYKRSMHDRKIRGYGARDAFKFFDDDNLEADYSAVLEYKLLEGSPWVVFCRIFVKRSGEEYYLVDGNGDKMTDDGYYVRKSMLTMFLQNSHPTPRQFLCAIGAKKELLERYQ